jgi:hypothetical protein
MQRGTDANGAGLRSRYGEQEVMTGYHPFSFRAGLRPKGKRFAFGFCNTRPDLCKKTAACASEFFKNKPAFKTARVRI